MRGVKRMESQRGPALIDGEAHTVANEKPDHGQYNRKNKRSKNRP